MVKPYNSETIFPWWLVEEVIDILKRRGCRFATYSEFPLSKNQILPDVLRFYLELGAYKANRKNHFVILAHITNHLLKKASNKAFHNSIEILKSNSDPIVFLQHDADRQAYKTLDMMALEQQLDVVSSNFFFYKRNMWDEDKEPYEPDIRKLQEFEKLGFEIGYHLNAYERVDYDLSKVWEVVKEDLDFFKSNFNLKTFVPHGGVPGPNKINNKYIPYKKDLKPYSWAYNRKGYIMDLNWSDGYLSDKLIDPRITALKITRGQRIRFLMHPQYYGNDLMPNYNMHTISNQNWWRALWNQK